MTDAMKLVSFAEEFNAFETQLKQSNLTNEISDYSGFFQSFDNLQLSLNEILKNDSPYYNIFSILKIRHYEARVHTPFLCNLFNPLESHGQGELFLRSFLRDVLRIIKDDDVLDSVAVYPEFSMEYGRLDIMIELKINGEAKTIVIENKIYHHDGEEQLERYYQYLVQERRLAPSQYLLVYLTINKSLPSTDSISLELYRQLKMTNNITCCGYRQDITPWLRNCLEQVKAKRVYSLLHQYIETISTL